MKKMIYSFTTKESPKLSEVGGKAKTLVETTKAGFPVPEGLALSVDFFNPWLQEIKASSEWADLFFDVTKEKCGVVKSKAAQLKFSERQKAELERYISEIGECANFAVRSSSLEEDLKGTSFAGMYETYLGVTRDQLETTIAKAFASMFDFRVMEYKKRHGIDLENTCISVIIQRQLASDVSGVGFSLNPDNNCYDEAMINAAFGLGETIVSGVVTPDTYIVDKVKNEIFEKKINDKKMALWLLKDGGTVEKENENPADQALTDEQIIELAELIKKCEDYYGVPMDIEWAYENGKPYLLQARPITAYFPLYPEYITQPGETKHLYVDMIKLTQGSEISLSELGSELFCKWIEYSGRGVMPVGKDGILHNVNGRVYYDLTNMSKALGSKAAKKLVGDMDVPAREIVKDFDFKKGYQLHTKPKRLKGIMRASIKTGLRAIPVFMKAAKDPKTSFEHSLTFFNKGLDEIDSLMISEMDFDKRVDSVMNIFVKLLTYGLPVTMGVLTESKIKKMFKGINLDAEIIALSIDLKGNPTSEMGNSLVTLATFEEVQKTESGKDFAKGINDRSYSEAFLTAYNEHMKKFGCRGVGEVDIASIRPYEDLAGFFNQLKLINIDDNATKTSRQKKEKAYQKLLEAAKTMGKEKKFIKSVEVFNLLGIRERPKYLFVYMLDKLRQVVLELAHYFVGEGRLGEVNDIFMLNTDQIARAQREPEFDLKPLVVKNKEARELTKNVGIWPTIIDSRGKMFRYVRQRESGDLVGAVISPGIIKGRAKVLHTPFEKPLNKGDILVAKATEPVWTPVFINAAAVVLEVGGPLHHGAIIAREYGIPCVSCIDGATSIIKDGDLLEVDGTSGVVKIIRE